MRTLSVDAQALLDRAVAGERISMPQLVLMDLAVPQRMATGGYPLQWDGETWAPVGVGVAPVEDAAGGDASEVVVTLPAVTGAQLALALVEPVEGKAVTIYDALVDPTTNQVVDATVAWRGAATVPGIEDGAEAALGVICEHRLQQAFRPKPARYTDAEQRRRYTGDTSMDYDPATDGGVVVWPSAAWFRV